MLVAVCCFFFQPRLGLGNEGAAVFKQKERNSVSLELQFVPKKPRPLQRFITFLDSQPNAYATAFVVSDRLVLTAYHVISGKLDVSKSLALGFGRNEELEVKIYVDGCRVKVAAVDETADLALLEVCKPLPSTRLSFQSAVEKDEKVLLIAKPLGEKIVAYGTFYGPYAFNGIDYWSLNMKAKDGFSGSPVYNEHGELIGVFSGYDWSKRLAIISPGDRAQKLITDFISSPTKPYRNP